MCSCTDRNYLLGEQYRDATNIKARAQIYRYETNGQDWHTWLFDHLPALARARVLETGCGDGALWRKNAARVPHGWEIVLTDVSPGMLAAAADIPALQACSCRTVQADAEALPFADGSFDVVLANHMLYHVQDRARAIREARRVLRPQGTLLASTPGRANTQELLELIDAAAESVAKAEPAHWCFCLENGAAQLQAVFDDVQRYELHGCLEVPDAEPVVRYAASTGRLSNAELVALRAEVVRRIADHGSLRITTHVGVFAARGAQAPSD